MGALKTIATTATCRHSCPASADRTDTLRRFTGAWLQPSGNAPESSPATAVPCPRPFPAPSLGKAQGGSHEGHVPRSCALPRRSHGSAQHARPPTRTRLCALSLSALSHLAHSHSAGEERMSRDHPRTRAPSLFHSSKRDAVGRGPARCIHGNGRGLRPNSAAPSASCLWWTPRGKQRAARVPLRVPVGALIEPSLTI